MASAVSLVNNQDIYTKIIGDITIIDMTAEVVIYIL